MAREARKTTDDCSELCDCIVDRNEVRERILHAAEGRGRLHEAAERHGTGEVLRRRHDEWHDDGQLAVAVDIEVQELRPAHELPVILDDFRKALREADRFRLLAAVEGNALAVLAHAHHVETEIRLVALLVKVEPDELAADEVDADRAEHRVEQREPEHIAVDDELVAAKRHDEGA